MSEFVASEVAVADLTIGQYVHGDGPYAEFQGGTLVSIEPSASLPGGLALTFEREVSTPQGWLKVRSRHVATRDTRVEANIPLAEWLRRVGS